MDKTEKTQSRRYWRWNGALALLMSTALAASAAGPALAQNLSKDAVGPALPSLAPLVQKVQGAVVNVSVIEKSDASMNDGSGDNSGGFPFPGFPGGTPFDQFMQHFFQQGPGGMPEASPGPAQHIIALGSGFIIDPSGYIVTNDHVVNDASKVTVIFQDGSRHAARIVGTDKVDDLALLKISSAKPLPYVSFGNSDAVRVGDWVVAVGNPFGLGGSVTAGIVSARSRDIGDSKVDYMQIDAPINKGNSGGPTFDMQGQVVGINTAIYSPNGGSIGIAFDIPSNTAKSVIDQLRATGHVEHGWLGVSVQSVTPQIASAMNLSQTQQGGALVSEVSKDSPAASAGLKAGDVITGLNGQTLHAMHDLPHLIAAMKPGDVAKLSVVRDGHDLTVPVTIGNLDKSEVASAGKSSGSGESSQKGPLGLALSALTPDERQQLQLPDSAKGVVVASVAPNSVAAEAGIVPGDVIKRVDNHVVNTPAEALHALREATTGKDKSVLLLLDRQGSNIFIGLSSNSEG